jgi:anti-anti-sigma factor
MGATPVDDPWRPFRCEVRPQGEELWIVVEGEFELDSAETVSTTLGEHIDHDYRSVVLDLGGVTFMDSSGLRVAIEASKAATGRGLGFAMVPGPPAVQRIFAITGTSDMFPPPAPR